MAFVRCSRDLQIISKTGYSAMIRAIVVNEIPDVILLEARMLGCFECDAEGNILGLEGLLEPPRTRTRAPSPEPAVITKPELTKAERKEAVRLAVIEVLNAGEPTLIDKNGLPYVKSVSARAGFRVTPIEILHIVRALKKAA